MLAWGMEKALPARSPLLGAAAALLLAACTSGAPAPSPSSSITTTPAPAVTSAATSAAPPSSASPTPSANDSEGPSDAAADSFAMPPLTGYDYPNPKASRIVTDVRVGRHEGFDRVVVEFSDNRTADAGSAISEVEPGYDVAYVDKAVSDGKGDEVKVPGSATLDIHLSGVTYPEDGDPQPFGTVAGAGGVVAGVESVGPFEGISQVVVGIDEERPVRVTTLADPFRLVFDIRAGD